MANFAWNRRRIGYRPRLGLWDINLRTETLLMITCLDPIAQNHGEGECQLRAQRHPVTDDLALHQRDDLAGDFIDVEGHFLDAGLVGE
jgi:hypothetical protein